MGNRRGGALAIALVAATVSPVAAGPRPDDIFLRYHAAIYAAQLCEGWRLEPSGYDDPEWDRIAANRSRMDTIIAAKTPGELSPTRRLRLMQAAKQEANRVVAKSGCEATQVRGWLAIFHADLESVLLR